MYRRITVIAAIVALLAGCSSEDDQCEAFANCSDNTGAGGGVTQINKDNALAILREAWFAASTSSDLPAFIVATGVGDTSGGVVVAPGGAAKIAIRNRVSMTPFGPTAYNCPTSGTFTVTGDVTDPNTVTAADFATYDSIACNSGTGFTVDGTFRVDINAITGDPLSGQFAQDQLLTFTDFQAVANLTTTLNGDHSAIIDSQSAGQLSVTFGGSSLLIDEQSISLSLRNYSGLFTIQDGSPFDTTLLAAGTVSSSVVQGSFDFVTGEMFEKPLGQPPSNGILDAYGSNFSTARVAVVDETLVRVEVDANGSGNYEDSSTVSWQEFLTGNVILNWSDTGQH